MKKKEIPLELNEIQETNNINDPIRVSGIFRYTKTNFFCCSKLVNINLFITKKRFILKFDESKKEFLNISRDKIISINKRQLTKEDVFKISIHYIASNDIEDIKEVKIKTLSRLDTDKWLEILINEIKPKKYQFNYDKELYEDLCNSTDFFNTNELYITMSKLEYILSRRKFIEFFNLYKNKYKKNNNYIDNIEDNYDHPLDLNELGIKIIN